MSLDLGWAVERGRVELATATWGLVAVCPSSVSLKNLGPRFIGCWGPAVCVAWCLQAWEGCGVVVTWSWGEEWLPFMVGFT